MKSSNLALIVAIIALLIGGGLYLYDQKVISTKSSVIESAEDTVPVQNDQGSTPVPQKIDLSPVSGLEATGISNRVFANNEFILTVSANLPKLDGGMFYRGWMKSQTDIVNLGTLEDDGDTFYLEYKSDKDMSGYNQIFIDLAGYPMSFKTGVKARPERYRRWSGGKICGILDA